MSTPRTVEREHFLQSIWTTAVEGGINYWSAIEGYHWSDDEPASMGGTLHEINGDETDFDGPQHPVTIDMIATGLRRFLERVKDNPNYAALRLADRTNGDDGDYDASDADNIVQMALFNELRYG